MVLEVNMVRRARWTQCWFELSEAATVLKRLKPASSITCSIPNAESSKKNQALASMDSKKTSKPVVRRNVHAATSRRRSEKIKALTLGNRVVALVQHFRFFQGTS